MPFSADEQQERIDFILGRLKRGFPIAEVQQQFSKQFAAASLAASRWIELSLRQSTQQEAVAIRNQQRTIALAMLHDQILSHQDDIDIINAELMRIKDAETRRDEIEKLLATARTRTKAALQDELEALPVASLNAKLRLLSGKTRIRSDMQKAINDLFDLQGVSAPQSNWRGALYTLLDNSLISPHLAESILTMIDDFEQNIRRIEEVAIPEALPPATEADFDDILDEIPIEVDFDEVLDEIPM
jgi:SpoVK/Ycf46/Vps4 family AAA+-type ATPase